MGATNQGASAVKPTNADQVAPQPAAAPAALNGGIRLVPELMDKTHRHAVAMAAEELLADPELLRRVWPGAYDARFRKGLTLDHGEVELVVLHLDRIGAPAGASGAKVFAAYFVHRPPASDNCAFLASPPLIVKLGDSRKLSAEAEIADKWPTLTGDVEARFALPITCRRSGDLAVLWSPFRSSYDPDQGGQGQEVGLADLWKLLDPRGGDENPSSFDGALIESLIGETLHIMRAVHRGNRASYGRKQGTYADHYHRYLRRTTEVGGARHDLLRHLFGEEATTLRFGKAWPNPRLLIARIIEEKLSFHGVIGPAHGDLHPKNIVRGFDDAVQIIDFEWAHDHHHVIVDYLLLDLNLRAVTLPSHIPEDDVLRLAAFLDGANDASDLPASVAPRAKVIQDAIWKRARDGEKIVENWRAEYLIPYFLVAYGLLVYLDAARNQDALIATVLAAAKEIEEGWVDA